MSSTVRIENVLLPLVDDAVKTVMDDFGAKRYRCRKDFVDDAVKKRLREFGLEPDRSDPEGSIEEEGVRT
jgi:DNA-directed RNA polymerase subunit N (RpoN/RPB10)